MKQTIEYCRSSKNPVQCYTEFGFEYHFKGKQIESVVFQNNHYMIRFRTNGAGVAFDATFDDVALISRDLLTTEINAWIDCTQIELAPLLHDLDCKFVRDLKSTAFAFDSQLCYQTDVYEKFCEHLDSKTYYSDEEPELYGEDSDGEESD